MSFKKKPIEDDTPALADDRDDTVAAPAASDSGRSGPTLSKRSFLRGLAAGGAATASGAASLKYGSDEAEALVISGGAAVAAAAGAAALGYYTAEKVDAYTGDSGEDLSGYTGADALRSAARSDLAALAAADEGVHTSLQNHVEDSKMVAISKGKKRAMKALNSGKDEATAKTEVDTIVDQYYAIVQENLVRHADTQNSHMKHIWDQLKNHGSTTVGDVFHFSGWSEGDNYLSDSMTTTETVTLADGNSIQITVLGDTSASNRNATTGFNKGNNLQVSYVSDGGSTHLAYDTQRYRTIWSSIDSVRTTVQNNLDQMVTDIYANYQAGDVDHKDMLDPLTLASQASEENHYAYAGAQAAVLGLDSTTNRNLEIFLHNDNVVVRGSLYTDYDPGGEGFQVGKEYDPTLWGGTPCYISYSREITTDDGTDSTNNTTTTSSTTTNTELVEINQPFTIESATDTSDGSSVSAVTPQESNYQDYDATKIKEQMDRLNELQQEMQTQAEADQTSGGGGMSLDQFSIGGIPGTGVVAIAIGGVLWLFSQDDN